MFTLFVLTTADCIKVNLWVCAAVVSFCLGIIDADKGIK